jgi:cytochrome c-type biogenesis protein CcmF
VLSVQARSRSRSSPSSSSPRTRSGAPRPPPFDGNDLNPLLQDPGLAFHPPFLYLGYVGLSMAYSFAIAALIEGRVDAAWARWVRPWTLLAWVFLTIGIALGSFWAYYELGWGGWWFWDPVENVSFMPWLLSAALLHSAIVVEKRDTLKSLDDPARDPRLLVQPDRRLRGALGHHHLGACLRHRPRARRVPAVDPRLLHRRIADALRLARADAEVERAVFSSVSRESGLLINNVLLVVSTWSSSSGRCGRWSPRR